MDVIDYLYQISVEKQIYHYDTIYYAHKQPLWVWAAWTGLNYSLTEYLYIRSVLIIFDRKMCVRQMIGRLPFLHKVRHASTIWKY